MTSPINTDRIAWRRVLAYLASGATIATLVVTNLTTHSLTSDNITLTGNADLYIDSETIQKPTGDDMLVISSVMGLNLNTAGGLGSYDATKGRLYFSGGGSVDVDTGGVDIIAPTAGDDVDISAVDIVQLQCSGNGGLIQATTAGVVIQSLFAGDSITMQSSEDVTASATDDISITATDDVNITGADVLITDGADVASWSSVVAASLNIVQVSVPITAFQANATTTFKLLRGVSGTLLSATWDAAAPPASAGGTILALLRQSSDAAARSDNISIETTAAVWTVANGGTFDVGGLYLSVTSNNADATSGYGGTLQLTYRRTGP